MGSRTGAKNPDRADYDLSLPEPDSATWQVVEIELNRFDGARISIELLRPREWIEARGWSSGQVVQLSLPDMETAGFGRVQAVRPSPPIAPGEGAVVIGRFATSHAPSLTRVRFEGGAELLGTAIHPIWSVDREDWVGLGALTINERVLSREGPIRVLAIDMVCESLPVYNIEVHGEHVYEATELGLLVHNSTPCNLVSEISLPDGRVVDVNAPRNIPAGAPGSAEHKALRWEEYQARGGPLTDYQMWSNKYEAAMTNPKVGLGREAEYRAAFGGENKVLNTPYGKRQIDNYIAEDRYLGQIKTGPEYLTTTGRLNNVDAIKRDEWLVKQGYTVEWVLEKGGSKPLIEALEVAGIKVHIGPKIK